MLETSYVIGVIVLLFLIAIVTRFLPFIFVKQLQNPIVKHIGAQLPVCIMLLLVVHCLQTFHHYSYRIPEIISIIVVVLLHVWKRNIILSVFGGTGFYLLLSYFLFSP